MENYHYKVIKNRRGIRKLVTNCVKSGVASLDFETNGTYIQKPWWVVTTLAVAFQPGSAWVIHLGHPESPNRHGWKKLLQFFLDELFYHQVRIFVYNANFEYRIFKFFNTKPQGGVFDVMLMKYLLNEDRPNDLKSLVANLLPDYAGYDVGNGLGKKATEERVRDFWENIDLDELSEYNALDADLTLRLALYLEQRLIDTGLYRLYRNLYCALSDVLSSCILDGVKVDKDYLLGLESKYAIILADIDKEIRSIEEVGDYEELLIEERVEEYVSELEREIDFGDLTDRQMDLREDKIIRIRAWEPGTKKEEKLLLPINFGSNKQLAGLLFSEDGLDLPMMGRTKAGAPSTKEEDLIKMQPEDDTGFIEILLRLRGVEKVFTTYVKNLLADQLHEGKIHPSYLLHGTTTGRLSSRGPNFQNIPRVTSDPFVKGMFYAPPGMYFIESDFSQAELRMVAIMAQDKAMLETFESGKNIHVNTAVLMFNEDYKVLNKARKDDSHPLHIEMVKKHKTAKVLNFAILYGMGPDNLAIRLSIATGERYTKKDAIDFTDKWFDAFPQVKKWMKKMEKMAKNDCFIENPFGFKRRFPIFEDPANKRFAAGEWNAALRVCVNAPIQGGASMLTQMVNIEVRRKVLEGKMPSYIRLVSTVHDSLEYYVKKEDIHWYVRELNEIIDRVPEIATKWYDADLSGVYFKMSTEVGVRWNQMHEYEKEKDYEKAYKPALETFEKFREEHGL